MLTITLLSIVGLVILFAGFAKNNRLNQGIGALGLVISLISLLFFSQDFFLLPGLDPQLLFDSSAIRFSSLAILFTLAIIWLSGSLFQSEWIQSAEFLTILIFSLVGAVMLTSFTHMITLFVGLETMGISLYILAASDKKSAGSNEAGLKYLLLGAFATGITLFGMAMIYGATGTLDFSQISNISTVNSGESGLMQIGIFFLAIGILFKISAVPFHFWAPDVYEGSPHVVMAYMSVVVKIASFAALFRIFGVYLQPLSYLWWDLFYWTALASLIVGNTLALVQTSLKRQLAYSSISHSGFLLLAILAMQGQTLEITLCFYLFIYGASVMGVFGILTAWYGTQTNLPLNDLKGAAKKDHSGAVVLTLCFLSMAGIPLTGGFFAKWFMFSSAMQGGLLNLLIVAVIGSVIGAAYYFKPIRNIWFSNEAAEIAQKSSFSWLGYLGAGVLLLSGLFPDVIRQLIMAL